MTKPKVRDINDRARVMRSILVPPEPEEVDFERDRAKHRDTREQGRPLFYHHDGTALVVDGDPDDMFDRTLEPKRIRREDVGPVMRALQANSPVLTGVVYDEVAPLLDGSGDSGEKGDAAS